MTLLKQVFSVTLAMAIMIAPGSGPIEAFARSIGAPVAKTAGPMILAPGVSVLNMGFSGTSGNPAVRGPSLQGTLPVLTLPTILPASQTPAANVAAAPAKAALTVPVLSIAAPAQSLTGHLTKETPLAVLETPKAERKEGAAAVALGNFFDNTGVISNASVSDAVAAATPAPRKNALNAADEDRSGSKTQEPVSPKANPELFRPKSSRMGIGPIKYVWWTTNHKFMQWFNHKLSKDPNNGQSWDKWPSKLGLLWLITKIRFLRAGALTNPYDYATNDNRPAEYTDAKRGKKWLNPTGEGVLDNENPLMGAANTRMGSNNPPKKVRPDFEKIEPTAREVGKLRWRLINSETGRAILNPARILNDMAGGWIQFMFHGFGGNTKRNELADNPITITREDGSTVLVDRTSQDETRVTNNGRPTPMGERPHAWIQAQIYGGSQAEEDVLRSFKDGKMKMDEDGHLQEDPNKPGIDRTGFNNNYSPELSFLHWIFTAEHNAIAEHLKSFNPDWDDETLFQMARMVNSATMSRIHTVEWTKDLLQHQTLQEGMHADWYGLVGTKLKLWIMRQSYRHPWFAKLIRPLTRNDTLFGMPGSSWEHHDGPFQVPKEFRLVYRLHELVLDDHDLLDPETGELLDRIDLIDFVHGNTRPIVKKFGMDVLANSFVKASAGALTLNNFPRALTNFNNQQDDMLARGMLVNASRGNQSLNEKLAAESKPAIESFLQLAKDDAELADVFERAFDGDLNNVGENFDRAYETFLKIRGNMTDLAERDVLREREDGTGTYNEFRRSLGEPPVKSFLELTGGDVQLAKAISETYVGDIDLVDAGIGILAEPKPAGFALSYTQFYQFILNAPRRVKSNRHMTEFFTLDHYTPEGMAWVEHAGGMLGAMRRHLGKAITANMEGVIRAFAPWKDPETFPMEQLAEIEGTSGKILSTNLRTLALGAVAGIAAVFAGAATPLTASLMVGALALPSLLYFKRMLAWRFMQKAWQGAYTDIRTTLFPTLFKGEKWANHSAKLGGWGALGVLGGAGYIAYGLWAAHPIVAVLTAVVALSALSTRSLNKTFQKQMALVKISLQNRLREGMPIHTNPDEVPGKTALEKRYWFLKAPGDQPVAKARTTYLALREHGLSPFKAFMTALLSHLLFGPKTQRGLGIKGRWKAGILLRPFAIYLPNLIQAQGRSSTRIFAEVGNDRGLTPGDVDMQEFDRMFRSYAPGRDYMTAYDMSRMREWNAVRDMKDGRGNLLSRFMGKLAGKRRADQLLALYADEVVEEDRSLVPAISKARLLRVYQGLAQEDIRRERAMDGIHSDLSRPQPIQ